MENTYKYKMLEEAIGEVGEELGFDKYSFWGDLKTILVANACRYEDPMNFFKDMSEFGSGNGVAGELILIDDMEELYTMHSGDLEAYMATHEIGEGSLENSAPRCYGVVWSVAEECSSRVEQELNLGAKLEELYSYSPLDAEEDNLLLMAYRDRFNWSDDYRWEIEHIYGRTLSYALKEMGFSDIANLVFALRKGGAEKQELLADVELLLKKDRVMEMVKDKIREQFVLEAIIANDPHPERGEIKYDAEADYYYRGDRVNGPHERWDDNGQLCECSNWKDCMLDGLRESWWGNGQLAERCTYKNGELDGLYESWYSNGQPWERCTYKNDQRDGLSEEWYKNGRLKERSNWREGKRNGLFEFWYENGQLKERSNYKNDERCGLYERWDEDGQLLERSNYKIRRPDGLYEVLTSEGKVYSASFSKGTRIRSSLLDDFTPIAHNEAKVSPPEEKNHNITSPKRKRGRGL